MARWWRRGAICAGRQAAYFASGRVIAGSDLISMRNADSVGDRAIFAQSRRRRFQKYEEEAACEQAKWLELSTNARQLDEIYTPRDKVTPAALAMVMSVEGASLHHRSAGWVSPP